ncbi:GNAT family N-acetyltransferase [Jiangella ureilytica]|uniref:GNAT family N-acetyltransferase n=1 Tax=Jiangella ureilytica TaxID=2530374 RepID=A0A4R4RD83_9ACTN|nr:GNAT family N-acetyltransferase [Jiangella ureilytica]TDC47130.1 GNAT family N-acetyltransferase [Jiangella ureilytica]
MISVRQEAPDRWTALRSDGGAAGRLRLLVRPDDRRILLLQGGADGPLLDTVLAAEGDGDLYAEAGEDDGDRLSALTSRDFTVARREHLYAVPTTPPTTPPGTAAGWPDGFAVVSAADADMVRLTALDRDLRRDVPGTGEWRTDPRTFRRETFGDPEFDPSTYLVAVDGDTGGYAGLVRVWIRARPARPRLGLIGVLPAYRRRGLARALVARVFGVLRERGEAEVVCEVDETNAGSNALFAGFGARRIGGSVELVRPARNSLAPPAAG